MFTSEKEVETYLRLLITQHMTASNPTEDI